MLENPKDLYTNLFVYYLFLLCLPTALPSVRSVLIYCSALAENKRITTILVSVLPLIRERLQSYTRISSYKW